jgi:hypothetical protein
MTPKEKAIQLVYKMYATQGQEDGITYHEAIDCALIAVEELIEATDYYYWTEVKKEIEKI